MAYLKFLIVIHCLKSSQIYQSLWQGLASRITLYTPLTRFGIKNYFIYAFDKVWHQELLYKLKSVGISGELYSLLENYVSGWFQRIISNWQTESWWSVQASVLQGSILDLLNFSYFISDLPNKLKSNTKVFADDTSLFTIVRDKIESTKNLNNDQ